ncbi:MAG: Gfo/Idh/MocA family oxidoreductase [Actinomycetes bacterium]
MFRIAVVGGGRMGRVHVRALADSTALQVSGVVEPSAQAAAALPAGLSVYASVAEMLATDRPDGVVIAAPSGYHVDLVGELAAAGVPILCEKPCGVTVAETTAAAALVAAAAVPFQVGYWRRFVPELVDLQRRITDGSVGELYLVSCWQWDQEPASAQFRTTSGGICADMGVHEFDQIRWLSGQEIDVLHLVAPSAESDQAVAGDPESLQLLASLSGGAAASVSLGRRYPPGDMARVEVFGMNGAEAHEFLSPETGEASFLSAIRAQSESFARYVGGAARQGASIDDAIAALTVAERAAVQLRELLA